MNHSILIIILTLSLAFLVSFFTSRAIISAYAFETENTDASGLTFLGSAASVKSWSHLRNNDVPRPDIHQGITEAAFVFLKDDVVKMINTGHEWADFPMDNQNNPSFHFDSCTFDGATANINNHYRDILKNIGTRTLPGGQVVLSGDIAGTKGLYEKFGEILHTVADFYSHSNWVELQNTPIDNVPYVQKGKLIDDGLDLWRLLNGNTIIDGTTKPVKVIEGKNSDSSLTRPLQSPYNGHIVLVNNGQYAGLISGVASSVFNPQDKGNCPPNIAIGHWDPYYWIPGPLSPTGSQPVIANIGTVLNSFLASSAIPPDLLLKGYTGKSGSIVPPTSPVQLPKLQTGINKDEPERPMHYQARDLAIAQTKHEWCRLIDLVEKQDKTAAKLLFSAMVKDKGLAYQACGNLLPVANAGTDQTVGPDTFIRLDGSASHGFAGNDLTYSWTVVDAPAQYKNILIQPNNAKPTLFSPSVPITLTFQLVVSDGLADSDPAVVHVTVDPKIIGHQFIVNTNVQDNDPCTQSHCSLPEAIKEANTNPGRDLITFNLPLGNLSIPAGGLPEITDPVVIDGTTQPGFSTAGKPIVELKRAAGTSFVEHNGNQYTAGLVISAGDTVVKGLLINNYDYGIILRGSYHKTQIDSNTNRYTVTPTSGNVIEGNYIGSGIDSSTSGVKGNSIGIDVEASNNNKIGGLTSLERNVISGNTLAGIRIIDGIKTEDVRFDPSTGQITDTRTSCDIQCASSNNMVERNYIGIDSTGKNAVPNGYYGISILRAHDNLVGGTGREATARNIISGNGKDGIIISGDISTNNIVEGNYIGIDADGVNKLPNQEMGVRLSSVIPQTSSNAAPGSTTYMGTPALNSIGNPRDVGGQNIISGNGQNGIYLGEGALANQVDGNYIGTDPTGKIALGNSQNGIAIVGAPSNIIGGLNTDAPLSSIAYYNSQNNTYTVDILAGGFSHGNIHNIISGNGQNGIYMLHDSTNNNGNTNNNNNKVDSHNFVLGNYIGTDVSGRSDLGNLKDGVAIEDASKNLIAKPDFADPNVISFNKGNGVSVVSTSSGSAIGNYILGNDIHSNSKLGIDLGNDGVTRNHEISSSDGSSNPGNGGPNDFMNYPTGVVFYSPKYNQTILSGKINNATNLSPSSAIAIYANQKVNPSGYGEGQRLLGFVSQDQIKFNNNTMIGSFVVGLNSRNILNSAFDDGFGSSSRYNQTSGLFPNITATASNEDFSTSEFSPEFKHATPPIANAGVYQRTAEGQTVTLNGTNSTASPSEPGATIVSYSWEQLPSQDNNGTSLSAALRGANTATPTFVAPNVTAPVVIYFRLTVTDSNGAIDSDAVPVLVTKASQTPDYCSDNDNDWICNEVDTIPYSLSNNFSDTPLGGTTNGTIVDRGSQLFNIKEEPNPDGVRITDLSQDPSIGVDLSNKIFAPPQPANFTGCDGAIQFYLNIGDEVILTCGSADLQVIKQDPNNPQPIPIIYHTKDGITASTSLDADNKLIFDPISGRITAPSNNSHGVAISTQNKLFLLQPGQTVDISNLPTVNTTIISAKDITGKAITNGTSTNSSTIVFNFKGDISSFPDTQISGFECILNNGTSSASSRTIATIADCSSPLGFGNIGNGNYTFFVRGLDSHFIAGPFVNFTWTVSNNNTNDIGSQPITIDHLIANAGVNQTVDQGQIVTLQGNQSSSSTTGNTTANNQQLFPGYKVNYLWKQIAGPAVVLNGSDTVNPTFTAPVLNSTAADSNSNATLTFELTVSDSIGQTASDQVSVFVNPAGTNGNNAHHLKAIAGPDQSMSAASDALSLTANGTVDPSHQIVSYKWTQVAGPSLTQLNKKSDLDIYVRGPNCYYCPITSPFFDVSQPFYGYPVTATINDFPILDNNTKFTFKLTVTDETGLNASSTMNLNYVVADNTHHLTANGGADQTVSANTTKFTGSHLDSQFYLNDEGSTVDDTSIPSQQQAQILRSQWLQIAGPPVYFDNLGYYSCAYCYSGPGNDPAFVTFPTLDNVANNTKFTFKYSIADDQGEVSSVIKNVYYIIPSNTHNLVASTKNTQKYTVPGLGYIALNGSASSVDPPANILSYQWTQIAGPAVHLQSSTNNGIPQNILSLSASPYTQVTTQEPLSSFANNTKFTFKLTVADDQGEVSSDVVDVYLVKGLPMTANAGPQQIMVNEGQPVTLNGTWNDPNASPENPIVSTNWYRTDNYSSIRIPGLTIYSGGLVAADPRFTFTAPYVQNDTTLQFRFYVQDAAGQNASSIINVVVKNDANRSTDPPIADAGCCYDYYNNIFTEGGIGHLDGTNSYDPQNSPITYSWKQIPAPENSGGSNNTNTTIIPSSHRVVLQNANTATPSFVVPNLPENVYDYTATNPDGSISKYITLYFELTVTNAAGQSANDTARIHARNINQAPLAYGQTISTTQNSPANVTLKATDPDNDTISSFSIVSTPLHGRLEVATTTSSGDSSVGTNNNGKVSLDVGSVIENNNNNNNNNNSTGRIITYTPDSNYTGQDNFQFKANDGMGNSANTATVLISVLPANYTAPTTLSNGDIFVIQSNGFTANDNVLKWFSPDGIFVKNLVIPSNTSSASSSSTTAGDAITPIVPTGGIAFDPSGNLYATANDNTIKKFDKRGTFGGNFVNTNNNNNTTAIAITRDYSLGKSIVFDINGNAYVEAISNAGNNRNLTILKYDSHGNFLTKFNLANNYDYVTGNYNNIDSMTLAANECTLYYVTGTSSLKRFNVCSNTQLPDFASVGSSLLSLKALPGGAGLLAVAGGNVYRFDLSGNVVKTFGAPYEMHNGEAVSVSLSKISLDPDGKSIWSIGAPNVYGSASSTKNVYKFDMATGNVIAKFSSGGDQNVDGFALKGAEPLPFAPNIPPQAKDQTITVQGNTASTISLIGSDLNKDPLFFRIVSGPSNGKLEQKTSTTPDIDNNTISLRDGSVHFNMLYTPNTNFTGIDHFVYKTTDTMADSSNATVNIVVTAPPPPQANRAPLALGGDVRTFVNAPVSSALFATDPDSDHLTYRIIKYPTHGTITDFNATSPYFSYNPFTYVPDQGYEGRDSFVYQVNDGQLDSNNATVLLSVQPHVPENIISLDINVTKDNLNRLANNTSGYTHILNLTSDLHGSSITSLKFGLSCSSGGGCFGDVGDINSTGPYSAQTTYKAVPPISVCSKDTIHYDTFSYYAADGNGTFSNEGQISIRLHDFPIIQDCTPGKTFIVIKNNPPVAYGTDTLYYGYSYNATDQTIHVIENKSLSFELPARNTDYEYVTRDNKTYSPLGPISPDNLTFAILSYPKHGNLTDFSPSTLIVKPAVSFGDAASGQTVIIPLGVKYTPQPGYIGNDSIVFRVNDGKYDSNNATVRLTVSPPPPPPPSPAKVGVIGGSTICTDTDASSNSCQVTDANYIMNGGVLLSPNKQKYEFVGIPLPLSSTANGSNLSQFSTIILNVASESKVNGGQGLGCDTNSLNSTEKNALVSFMRNSGGKLIIYDSECRPSVDYNWLPRTLQFSTFNPGQLGAECTVGSNCGATIVENNTLASNKPGDKNEIDLGNSGIPKPGNPNGSANGLCAITDACGDANVMVGLGTDLCKSIVATIPTTTGTSNRVTGTVYAYSRDGSSTGAGKGMLMYNGFDLDDILFYLGSSSSGANALQKLLLQELDQPVNPSGLGCKVPVVNQSPPIANAGANQTVSIGNTVTLDGSNSTDPDGGNITSYAWKQANVSSYSTSSSSSLSPVLVNLTGANTAKATFVAPNVVNDTLLKFELTVTDSDGGANNTGAVYVMIKAAERGGGNNNNNNNTGQQLPPIAVTGPNQTVSENTQTQTITLNGNASYDPDATTSTTGAIKTYRWIQIAGPSVTLSSPTSATPSFTVPTVTKDTTLTFKLIVTDADDNATSTNAAITNILIKHNNLPPVADAGPDQIVNESSAATTTAVTLNGTKSSDPDGNITSYSWIQIAGPSVTLTAPNTAKPTFTAPSVTKDTALSFKLTIIDNANASSSATTNVRVNNVNIAPIANAGIDQTVNASTLDIKLDGSKSYDRDGTIASYQWTQTSGPAVTLQGADTATPTFTAPSVTENSTLTFALTVTDNDNATSTNPATVNVVVLKQQTPPLPPPTNQPPLVNDGTAFINAPNKALNITLSGTDAENNTLTFSIVSNPANGGTLGNIRIVNSTSANVTYTPKANFTGTDSFTYKANDGTADSSNTGTITIHINALPVAANDKAATNEDTPVNVNVLANDTDADNDPLTIAAIATQPSNGSAVINTNNNTITYTPASGFYGSNDTFTYVISDGHGGGAESVSKANVIITVNHVNHAPTVVDTIAASTDEDKPVNIILKGADKDAAIDKLKFSIVSNPVHGTLTGDTITDINSTAARVTYTPNHAFFGSDSFTYNANDGTVNSTNTGTVTITVNHVNHPPIANAGTTNQTVNENTTDVKLDGSASYDPDLDDAITSYSWTQTNGPTVVLTGASTATPTFTAPSVSADTVLKFNLVVTDSNAVTSVKPATVSVLVKNVNIPPVANAGENQTVNENTTNVLLDGSKSYDRDGGIKSYNWTQIQTAGPSVTLQGANKNTSQATFTAPSVAKDTTLTFRLNVTDNDNASSTSTTNVLVKNVNIPPIANAGSDQTVNENATGVVLDGNKSFDKDGTIKSYTWRQLSGTNVTLAGANTSQATFTAPSVTKDSNLQFKLTVTDNDNATSTATTNMLVKNVNIAPIANAGTNQTVNENATGVTLDGSSSYDRDGTIKSYNWTQIAGPSVALQGSNSSARATFTAPSVNADTTLTFKLTIKDDNNSTSTATTNVLVRNVNIAPVANAGPDQKVDENTADVKLDGSRSYDRDGSISSYQWIQTSGPAVTLQGANTATPTFTAPSVTKDTTITFKLTVTDNDNAADSATTNILVRNVNSPPVANAGSDFAVNENTTGVVLDGTASTDPDSGGDTISSYSWKQTAGPTITLNSTTSPFVSFDAPSVTKDTQLTFELTVTDSNGAVSIKPATVNVLVRNVNIPPTANAGSNQTVNENTTNVVLDGSKSYDKDGSIKSYNWTQTAGPLVTLQGANATTARFTAPSVSKDTNLEFNLTVTDNDNANSSAITNVLVKNVNVSPIANAGSNQTVNENTTNVVLDGGGSYDKDGNITSYSWKQIPGSSSSSSNGSPITVKLNSTNTKAVSFTAPSVTKDTPLAFNLTVTDNDGASSSAIVGVLIKNVNISPVVNAGSDQTVNENATGVVLDGTGSYDKDGTINSYKWIQLSGPNVTLADSDTSKASFTSPSVSKDTTLTFKLTVTDNDNAANSATTNVLVKNVNVAPVANAGPSQTVNENTANVKLDGTGSYDRDGGTIKSYNWNQTSGPTVILQGANTATPTFTAPSITADTTLTFALTVTDNDGATSTNTATTNVLVKNVNVAPTAIITPANQTVNASQTVIMDGSQSNDNKDGGNIASYQWQQLSGTPVTLQDANTAKASFTAPSANTDTTLTFRLTVTDNDGGASKSTTANVIVKRFNQPPVANAGSNQTVNGGSTVTLDGSKSTDPDGGTIAAYQWTQTSGPTVTLQGANTAKPTFSAPSSSTTSDITLTFSLKVTDSDGGVTSTNTNGATTSVIVKRTNVPPIANAGSGQTVNGGTTVTLDGTGSYDPDGGSIASYSWTQTAGPSVTLQGANTAKPTFTAPSNLQQDTTFTFSLKVTDSDGGAASTNTATVNVLVKKQVIAVNQPPLAKATVISSTGNIIGYGSTVTLDGTGSYDPDGGSIVSYAWQQTAGPAVVTLSGANTAKASFAAPQLTADTTLTFALTVKDSDGGSTGSTSVNVVVAAHPGTIGYWKNHQQQTVSLLPQMLGPLYKVDSWTKASSVLNTASSANAYDGLAAQLLATKLDIKNGSPTCSSITNAVSQADTTLTNAAYKGPGTAKAPSGTTKTTVTNLQTTLDTYNNYGCMGLAASASGSMSIASTTNATSSPTTISSTSPQTATPSSSPTQKAAMNSTSTTTTSSPSPSPPLPSPMPMSPQTSTSPTMKAPTTTTQNTPSIATNTNSTTKPSSSSPLSLSRSTSTTPQRQQQQQPAQLPQLQGQGQQQQQLQQQLPMTNQILPPSLYPYQLQQQQQQTLQQQLSPLPPPIAVVGMSQVVDANTNVMLDGRNSFVPILQQQYQQQQLQQQQQPASNSRMIIAYQWTQIPVGVSVNLTNANSPTPSFRAPALPYDTTLAFSLRVMSNDGMVSSNPAIVYVMVKHYSGVGSSTGSSALQQLPSVQQQIVPAPQQPVSPSPQRQPQYAPTYPYSYPYTYPPKP